MRTLLQDIYTKVAAGQRLSAIDGLRLFESNELHSLGALADLVRHRKNGDLAYFVVNRHLNPTNVCQTRCALCAYGVGASDSRAYTYSVEEAVRAAVEGSGGEPITELHVVGGVNPSLPWTYYTDLLRALKRALPEVHLKAFTVVEIDWMARLNGLGVDATLRELQAAGLDSLPGGGAEIFDPAVRAKICAAKLGADEWLQVHRVAHRLGLASNATMLFGHVETPADRVNHLIRLRELQDETGGFQAFIPLAFHPENTALSHLSGPSGLDALRTMAVSRLLLDNFAHLKAYWVQLGADLAQVALHYGADDVDGTVVEEKVTHAAGAHAARGLPRARLVELIREAGFVPVQRDTLYRELKRW